MEISVTGRKMVVGEALKAYAVEKIGNSMKVMGMMPQSVEVVLHVERNRSISRPCVCEVTIRGKGHVVRVEEQEEDMYAAIDVAAAKTERQLRKFKTRVVERNRQPESETIRANAEDPDFKALMEELSEEDEIVRVKDIEFAPMTEEEALVQIDLLGHDFFAYTDRDTSRVCVLYRRTAGGYGLLRQTDAADIEEAE